MAKHMTRLKSRLQHRCIKKDLKNCGDVEKTASLGTFSQGLQACQSQNVSISTSFIKRGLMRTICVLHGGEPGPERRQIRTQTGSESESR